MSDGVSFINNTGYEGGALFMLSSYLTIADNSEITFQDNQATSVGGAICVKNIPIQVDRNQPCFYQLMSIDPNSILTFIDNTAIKGGHHIYGATTLTDCNAHYFNPMPIYSQLYNNIFNFTSTTGESFSDVSSDPTRVCLCTDGRIMCTDLESIFTEREVTPGEELTLSAVVVGANFGSVYGPVYASTDKEWNSHKYQLVQNIEGIGECHNLTYTIEGTPRGTVQLVLSTDGSPLSGNKNIVMDAIQRYEENGEIDINLLTTPLSVTLHMQDCPPGYIFNPILNICECNIGGLKCSFKDGKTIFNRENNSNIWLARKDLNDTFSPLLINRRCSSERCSNITEFDLSSPDALCVKHRSGMVCGKCADGYSVILGSAECEKCSNSHLMLLIVFAIAGVLLVFFLMILNLTVADGYINVFIFYCNIVWANKDSLLPPREDYIMLLLAWFNLDFGINTCFFDGLDDYTLTWLQFVFPIYIWSICIVIILLSRRFNILGNNGIPVLATLFLISYGKILYATISALTYTVTEIILTIQVPNIIMTEEIGNNSDFTIQWFKDANLNFMEGRHIPLSIFGIIFLTIICIPYTLALIFSHHLHQIQRPGVSRWILRFKHILDAYCGPFKDKKEYWVGVQLVVRAFLLLVSSLTYGYDNSLYHFINSVILVLVLCSILLFKTFTGPLYKSLWISFLENTLIMNMIALGGLSFLSETKNGPKKVLEVLGYILPGLVILQFLVLVIVRVFLKCQQKLCPNVSLKQVATLFTERALTFKQFVLCRETKNATHPANNNIAAEAGQDHAMSNGN